MVTLENAYVFLGIDTISTSNVKLNDKAYLSQKIKTIFYINIMYFQMSYNHILKIHEYTYDFVIHTILK